MHELFAQVLNHKDLSKAGDLFSLDDRDIKEELSEVLHKIQAIAAAPDYLTNDNDQSVVEICVTRVTSAIRETSSIEKHAPALVSLLESCLRHNLKPSLRDEDPPHTKIASDILSCLFLNYSKKSVMELGLPVAVKFLHQGSRELSRNMSSYLSLAAIDNAKLLAQHIHPIIQSCISGNRSLARVLPQIYAENPEPVNVHISSLVVLLPDCEPAEKNSLLQLCAFVAKNNPRLLEKHIPHLVEYLSSPSTSATVLQVLVDISALNPRPFVGHMVQLKQTADQQPATLAQVAKVIGAIGRINKMEGKDCMSYLTSQLSSADMHTMPILLMQIKVIAETHPSVLPEYISGISQYATSAPVAGRLLIQQLKDICVTSGSQYHLPERKSAFCQTEAAITVITVGNPTHAQQKDHVTLLNTVAGTGTLTQSKNASTSTRDINFPGLSTVYGSTAGSSIINASSVMGSTTLPYTAIPNLGNAAVNGSNVTVHQVSTANNSLRPSMTSLIQNPRRIGSRNLLMESNSYIDRNTVPQTGAVMIHMDDRARSPEPVIHGVSPGPQKGTSNSHLSSQSTISPHHQMVTSNKHLGSTTIAHQGPPTMQGSSILTHQGTAANHGGSAFTHQGPSRPRHPSGGTGHQRTSNPHLATSSHHISSQNQLHQSGAAHHPQFYHQHNQPVPVTNTYTGQPHAIPFRDAVQQFCEKHLDKIKAYMETVTARVPIPIKCTLQEHKQKRQCKLHFICFGLGEHCLYSRNFFSIRTRNPRIWIHLMFLAIQARSSHAVSQQDPSVGNLKACWDSLGNKNSFVRLVTSSFPSSRDQDLLVQELQTVRYFDVFEFDKSRLHWACFLCNHPEKAEGIPQDGSSPFIEGQLKEKKGRWQFFKRWKTRYFTLTGASITFCKKDERKATLPVNQIQSVKAIKKGVRDIPRAFEIFTQREKYVFKVKDGKNAEQWVQCLQIAVARSHNKSELTQNDLSGWEVPPQMQVPSGTQTKL